MIWVLELLKVYLYDAAQTNRVIITENPTVYDQHLAITTIRFFLLNSP